MPVNPLLITAVINLVGSIITSSRVGSMEETTGLLNSYASVAEAKLQDAIKQKTNADVDLSFASDFITQENVDKIKDKVVSKVRRLFKKKEEPQKAFSSALVVDNNKISVNEEQLCEVVFTDFILYVSEKDPDLFARMQDAMKDFSAAQEDSYGSDTEIDDSIIEEPGQDSLMQTMNLFGGADNG